MRQIPTVTIAPSFPQVQNSPNDDQLTAPPLTPSAFSRLSPEQYTQLEEVLGEFVGIISSKLLSQESTKALDFQQLLEDLMRYVRKEQREEFKQIVLRLLQEPTVHKEGIPASMTRTAATQAPTASDQTIINENFLVMCEQELIDIIGPIGKLLMRKMKASHPDVSIEELIELLVAEIPDSKKVAEFRDAYGKLRDRLLH